MIQYAMYLGIVSGSGLVDIAKALVLVAQGLFIFVNTKGLTLL